MMIGDTFFNGLVAFTEWAPRLGNAAIFGAEVIDATDAVTLSVSVEHRNQVDTSVDAAGSFDADDPDLYEKRIVNLKEFWRYKITVGGTSDSDWTHLRLLPPIWASRTSIS